MKVDFDGLRKNAMNDANRLSIILSRMIDAHILESEREGTCDAMNNLLSSVFTIAACSGENETITDVQSETMPRWLEMEYE